MPKIPLTISIPEKHVIIQPMMLDMKNDTLPCSSDPNDLARVLKVSELVALLKSDVEEKHRNIRVVGEISSFKQWRSGHCYFDIKDEQALLPAVMFRPHFMRVPFAVTDGLLVVFSGHVSIYKANAKLQMIVETMEPIGQGALALAFEQLKEKLKTEGLFDARHKKPIRAFNQCIGIITSSHGAVLRDMVRILKNRMPNVDILFSPVRVQGVGAAEEIKTALLLLDQTGACDVIIVGRGGGSLEDLFAFNSELVARAIFNAKTPIVSAVGHETDVTICDFVADLRAATPSHAATLVAPALADILRQLATWFKHLNLAQQKNLQNGLLALVAERRRLKDPELLLINYWQKLDTQSNQLNDVAHKIFRKRKQELFDQQQKLQQIAPFRQLRLKKDALFAAKAAFLTYCPNLKRALTDVSLYRQSLSEAWHKGFLAKRQHLYALTLKLDALSPLKVLARGYSVVQKSDDGAVLSKTAQFFVNQSIKIRIEDGVIEAIVSSKE